MIKKTRAHHTHSAAKLRRARRLYFKLVGPHITDGREGVRQVHAIAIRIQAAGLYAPSTSLIGIRYKIYKAAYDHSGGGIGWDSWAMALGYGRHPWWDAA